MSDKKELTDEELENISGGACDSDSEEYSAECPNCSSHNNSYIVCRYEERKFTCNDCGTKWMVDASGNVYNIEKN